MIYCRGYKQKYIDENNKKVVLVQLVCDDTPSNITVDDIVDFPKIYILPSDIILAPGSVAIVPSKSEMYMLGNDGTWSIVRRNIENNVPYTFRNSPDGIGNIMIDKIIGGTIAWQQLVDTLTTSVTIPNGHKYLHVLAGTYFLDVSDGTAISVTGGTENFHDLTHMFGSTIADYVYSLETATAGSGVAWLQAHDFFTKPYYAYNAGELMSVNTSAHITRDADDKIIGNYALDESLILNGLYKLDANNKLYCDGDEYESDGTVARNYVKTTFNGSNSENWQKTSGATVNTSYFALDIGALNSIVANEIISDQYAQTTISVNSGNIGINIINSSTYKVARIVVRPENVSDLTPTTFKALLAAKPLSVLYKIATSITETADPYINPQVSTPSGTEQYVDYAYSQGTRDVEIPVGHETLYK